MASHSFHFHDTNVAGGERFQPVIVAERRYFDTVPSGEFQYGFARVSFYNISIEYDVIEIFCHLRKVFSGFLDF
jgi:hypothetical protein